MITLEHIPPQISHGIIIPVHKGKGHDPFNPSSYRGISLTSIIAKVLEKIILCKMLPILQDNGFPNASQTSYISVQSCADGHFVTYETLHELVCQGDSPYLCLFNLEKAFDSIEYAHLLKHLFHRGVNGKTWRLICNWYSNSTSSVCSKGLMSDPSQVHRGVKQGSVLSPAQGNPHRDVGVTSRETQNPPANFRLELVQ